MTTGYFGNCKIVPLHFETSFWLFFFQTFRTVSFKDKLKLNDGEWTSVRANILSFLKHIYLLYIIIVKTLAVVVKWSTCLPFTPAISVRTHWFLHFLLLVKNENNWKRGRERPIKISVVRLVSGFDAPNKCSNVSVGQFVILSNGCNIKDKIILSHNFIDSIWSTEKWMT